MADTRKKQKGPQGEPIRVSLASNSNPVPSPALGSFNSLLPFLFNLVSLFSPTVK